MPNPTEEQGEKLDDFDIDQNNGTKTTQPEDTTQELEEKIRESIESAATPDNLPSQPNTAAIVEKPYDSRPVTDTARRTIAYWLLGLLTLLIVVALLCFGYLFWKDPKFDDLKNMVSFILTPLITLVSAATGFYFGSQNSHQPPS